ncbi:MAG: OadG family protein [Bacteroidales bacterium]|nr:OadG family protein [Bacteroidales bacterium]
MSKRALTLMLLCAILALPTLAQGRKNVRINEVMVQQDTTGGNGWVEFYNSSYGTNAVEKMFITTLSREEVKNHIKAVTDTSKMKPNKVLIEWCKQRPMDIYEIPRGDERNTKIAPRTHFVMEADGNPKAGTFHMPFTFTAGKENYIALYDVNGDLVDDVTIPASLKPGETYAIKAEGRLPSVLDDGKTEWIVKDGTTIESAITKGNYNIREVNENIEAFHDKDPHGYWIALLAMSVVFIALAILYICFKLFGVVSKRGAGKNEEAASMAPVAHAVAAPAGTGDLDGEKMAAICFALYQHLNAHDQESGILTLTPRDGSAWSGKSGLMRELPVIKK